MIAVASLIVLIAVIAFSAVTKKNAGVVGLVAVTFLSFVPLVFLKIGWTKHPMLTVISVVISVSALVLTILLGDRSVKRELRRRFHV